MTPLTKERILDLQRGSQDEADDNEIDELHRLALANLETQELVVAGKHAGLHSIAVEQLLAKLRGGRNE